MCPPLLHKLYQGIAELADDTGTCTASIAKIAQAAKISQTSVERALGRVSPYSVSQTKSGRGMIRTLLPDAPDEERSPMQPLQQSA